MKDFISPFFRQVNPSILRNRIQVGSFISGTQFHSLIVDYDLALKSCLAHSLRFDYLEEHNAALSEKFYIEHTQEEFEQYIRQHFLAPNLICPIYVADALIHSLYRLDDKVFVCNVK